MDYREYISAGRRELKMLVEAAIAGPVCRPVHSCPGWTVLDLLTHVGEFCGFWTHVLCEARGIDKTSYSDPPSDEGAVQWLAELGRLLFETLESTDGDTEVWTWYEGDKSACFIARRCANELAIHRYDAQSAGGRCSSIDATLALDGIDEIFSPLAGARGRTGTASGQSLHLHGVDPPGEAKAEWTIRLLEDRIEVEREHAKADLALRGSVSDLELILYGREPVGDVDRFGDETVLDLWKKEFTF